MKKKTTNLIISIIILFILLLLCLPIGFFTVFRDLDAKICIPRVTTRIGIEADGDHLRQYIKTQLHPGLNEQEVTNILRNIGPVSQYEKTKLYDGTTREGYKLNICLHPLNNVLVENVFDAKGILLTTNFSNSP